MKYYIPKGEFSMKASEKPKTTPLPRTINWLLYPSRFIGICCLNNNIKINNLQAIHTLILLLSYVAISLCIDIYDGSEDDTMEPDVSIFQEIVNIYLYFLLGIVCIALSLIKINNLYQFFNILLEIDSKLESIHSINNKLSHQYFTKLNILGLIGCFIILAISLTTHFWIKAIADFILALVIFATFNVFVGSLHLLKQRFASINQILCGDCVANKLIITGNNKLKIVANIHDRLCDAAGVLNGAYTVQLLGCFTLLFLGTLFAIFSDYRVFLGSEVSSDEGPFILLLRNSHQSLFMVVWGVVILSMTKATCDEANETGKVIHKIINNNSESVNIDNLRNFSLQLMHRNLSFNACYMFNLDYTLLYTLVGASTTYMVILIQFDLAKPSEPSCSSSLSQLQNKCLELLNTTMKN